VGRPGAADRWRVCTHRGRAAPASLTALKPREHEGNPLQREGEADDAAAVDARLELSGLDIRRGGDLRKDLVLKPVAGQPITLGRPASRAAGREHAGVLA